MTSRLGIFSSFSSDYLPCEDGMLGRLTIIILSASLTKWSNTLKQFAGKLPANCLSAFDHFMELAFKGLLCCEFCKLTISTIFLHEKHEFSLPLSSKK